MWLDHISYGCSDYRRTVAFYEALLGWKPGRFTGNQSTVDIGDVGGAIIRNRAGRHDDIDHISFGIDGFEPDKVEAELKKRGLGSPEPPGSGPSAGRHRRRRRHSHVAIQELSHAGSRSAGICRSATSRRANRHDT